jgi:hypothetical protein
MCVWFNNYGLLKIPLFFSKKKYSKNKKNPEVGHTKLPKFQYFHPHPPPSSYTSGKVPDVAFRILAKIPGNQL